MMLQHSSRALSDSVGDNGSLQNNNIQHGNSSKTAGSAGKRKRHKAGPICVGLLFFGLCCFGGITIVLHKLAAEKGKDKYYLKAEHDFYPRHLTVENDGTGQISKWSPTLNIKIHDPPPPRLTGTATYSMVLPLVCKEAASAQLLISTIYAFTDPEELETLLIVVDARDLPCVRRRMYQGTAHLRRKCEKQFMDTENEVNSSKNMKNCWVQDKIKYITSESIIPELSEVPRMAPDKGGRYFIPSNVAQTYMLQARSFGYIIQMLVKLAIAEHIQTDYYITLDADILCTKNLKYEKIIILDESDEKSDASDDKSTAETYLLDYDTFDAVNKSVELQRRRAINSQDDIKQHLEWWEATDSLLQTEGLVSNHTSGYMAMGVTPAIMHRNTVLQLQRYIEKLHKQPWRHFLIQACTKTMWTEYTLYHTYAVASGMFLKHHLPIGQDSNHHPRLYPWNNIWDPPTQLNDWDWEHDFDQTAEKEGYFLVTQASLHGVNVTVMEGIASKIRPHVPKGALPSTDEIRAFVNATHAPAEDL